MKKIRMTRVLALAMALVMALALVACGGTKSGPKKTDEELIVGKWETNIDFGKVMEDAMKEAGDEAQMLGDVDFSGITMKMNAEFKADGTYTIAVDKASGEAAMKQLVEKLVPALKEVFRQMMADQAGGQEVTDEMLDSALAMMGAESWDDLGDMFLQEMDTDEMFAETNKTGKYLIKDGKLYLAEGEDDPAEAEGTEYKVSDKSLTIEVPQEGDEEVPEYLRNLTFNRVG